MGLLVYDVTMRMKASYRLCWLYAISSTAISLIFSMSRFPDGFTGIESKTLNVTGTHSESSECFRRVHGGPRKSFHWLSRF